ncbi:hypothetical protein K1719_002885 [Acacia pycnantha]|nr:hypothetical protein K1719_002885 [Acacia pycnantha]
MEDKEKQERELMQFLTSYMDCLVHDAGNFTQVKPNLSSQESFGGLWLCGFSKQIGICEAHVAEEWALFEVFFWVE